MLLPIKRNTCSFPILFIWLLLNVMSSIHGRSPDRMMRVRCPTPESIPNGSYKLRRNNMVMRILCRQGFELQGPRLVECVRGKWYGDKPICAKRGCHINIPNPEHGHILMDNDFRMILFCLDNYKLAGNRFVYCNGTHWDREIGNCREPSYNVEHECDFETDDLCGWVYEETIGTEWKRQTAANVYTSYHTGPRHDHTSMLTTDSQTGILPSGGHYMLMETVVPQAEPGLLLSPIYERDLSLKTACCFQFYYFMYGSGVGDLKVYVRPISIPIKDVLLKIGYLKFQKSGNQNNLWNEGHFKIDELDDDFQIIFVASAGRNHLSDIAIDDVKLMAGEDCKALDNPKDDDDDSASEETTDEILIDTQSCRGRCLENLGAGFVRRFGHLYGRCNCHAECEEDDTCCPDYRSTCLSVIFDQSTRNSEDTTPIPTVEPKDAITSEPFKPLNTTTAKQIETTIKARPTTLSTTLATTSTRTTPTTTTTTTTKRPTTTTTKTTTRKISSSSSTTTTTTTTPKTTTTTATTTMRRTTPKSTTTATTTTTKKSTTTKTPTKLTTKSTTKINFFWKTTVKTTPLANETTKKQASTTSTSPQPTKSPITTLRPVVVKIMPPNERSKENRPSKSMKHEIISWDIDNTSTEFKSPASKILFTALILLLVSIAISTAYYRYKEDLKSWFVENQSSGDVETTSIRAKFRARTNRLSTSSTVMGLKSKLGLSHNQNNDDMNCLIDTDNDFDNNASLSIDNPVVYPKTKDPKYNISTNL